MEFTVALFHYRHLSPRSAHRQECSSSLVSIYIHCLSRSSSLQPSLVFRRSRDSLMPSRPHILLRRLPLCFPLSHSQLRPQPPELRNCKVYHNRRHRPLHMLDVEVLLNTTMDTNLATPLSFTLLDRDGFLASILVQKSAVEILGNFLGHPIFDASGRLNMAVVVCLDAE
jgi:hypothetical protein